jgi:hypothetical protein
MEAPDASRGVFFQTVGREDAMRPIDGNRLWSHVDPNRLDSGRRGYKNIFAVLAVTLPLTASLAVAADTCGTQPNVGRDSLKFAQYFLSKPQDAPGCAMEVVNGHIAIKSPTTNPAMTCPDMFAWKLFAESVTSEFWKGWAADQETWPGNGFANDPGVPLPLCASGQSGSSCCDPDRATNPGYDDPSYKAKSCPYFPGDHLAATGGAMPERIGVLPSKAHTLSFAADPRLREILTRDAAAPPQPGRKIRQSMAEVVFRNKPLFDFVFRNGLYFQEGIIKVFQANSDNIKAGAPYRVSNDAGTLSEIVFPVDSVMIKSDWLSRERAAEMGLQDDPDHPFVKMNITSAVTDNNGTILQPGEHWLLGLHISSKDIPNWVWATFEHVHNPGRCDYTGCNDSFGYDSPDAVAAGQTHNFTRPHLACDNLPLPSFILDLGKPYPPGMRRANLSGVFASLGIGTKDNTSLIPSFADRAWLSYELKGAQVDFVDSIGRPAHLANSVTEAGFVSTSSCMTCHARAGTAATGTIPPALGVFENGITDSGYLPSSNGNPVPDWYNRSGQPPTLQVLQTDFVWGFLAANSTKPPSAAVLALRPRLPARSPGLSVRERTQGD